MSTQNSPMGDVVRFERRKGACRRPVGIVGLGAIGASIGLALRDSGTSTVGLDVSRRNLRKALEQGAIERAAVDASSFRSCSEVFVAVPPSEVVRATGAILESTGATVVDVASVKTAIEAAIQNPRFVPTHPLRGTHGTGPEAARSDLFDGGVWVVCHSEATDRHRLEGVKRMIRRMGADPLEMTPQRHDSLVAVTSHLPHLLASSLVHLLGDRDPAARSLVARGFLDTTRIARSNPALWADITMNNRAELCSSLDDLMAVLEGVKTALRQSDGDRVESFFAEAAHLLAAHFPTSPGTHRKTTGMWSAGVVDRHPRPRHSVGTSGAVPDGV